MDDGGGFVRSSRSRNGLKVAALGEVMNDTSKAQAVETEIKFLLPDGAHTALETHTLLRLAETQPPRQEITTYYDTPEQAFRGAGAALRVREAGGRYVQTLKLRQGKNAFSRGEWEWDLANSQPDLSRLSDTPLANLVGSTVQPVFCAEVSRTVRYLRAHGGVVEIVTDLGWLQAGEHAEPIREVELELKEGDATALFAAANSLQMALDLVLGAESKSERGWRLATGSPPEALHEKAPSISPDASGSSAFQDLTSALLASLVGNQPAASTGSAEGVHRMRIAVRRLRTALALFRPHLAQEAEIQFTEALRRLGRILGEARDWDVFCSETLMEAGKQGVPDPLLQALRKPAEAERRAAHVRLREEFGQPDLTRLVLGLSAWAGDASVLLKPGDDGRLSEPVVDIAPELLEHLRRKVSKRGRRIRHRSEEELHDLRKALKRLRYALEFLAPLLKKRRLKTYLHSCKELQEDLGTINDAAMAKTLARRLGKTDPAIHPAVAALESWAEARRTVALSHLHPAWREFKDTPRPRFARRPIIVELAASTTQ
jgi:inorganic triphosphatase YgiF